MATHVQPPCPICGTTQFKLELHLHDYAVTGEPFTIQSCTQCGLWQTHPQPNEAQLPHYYQSTAYISHQTTSHSLFERVYFIARNFMIRKKLTLIEHHHAKGKLLDYGCGTGAFLAQAQKKGWIVSGYEPSATARTAADPRLRIAATPSELNGPFDVITLWHVLEHLPHIQSDLDQLRTLLAPGGLLVIAVPNHESWDATHYQQRWAGYDVPRHLWHFNQTNLVPLLNKHHLRHIATRPLLLDSFFVSLLSERYAQTLPAIAYIKAFWHGIYSNWKARRTTNYSSLIYLARK